MAKTGESQTGSVMFFCFPEKSGHGRFWKSTFKVDFCFGRFSFKFRNVYSHSMSDRFSAHVRPVVHVILFT